MTFEEIAERVDRGIDWLNDKQRGWYNEINLEILDIRYPACVLMQLRLGGVFSEEVGPFREWDEYGFSLIATQGFDASSENDGQGSKEWQYLNNLWREKIRAMREQDDNFEGAGE